MKILLIGLISLTSSFALSCPNLSGIYKCEKRIQNYDISFTVKNDTYQFNIDNEYFLADKQTHNLERKNVTGTYNSYCENGTYSVQQFYTEDKNSSVRVTQVDKYSVINKNTIQIDTLFQTGGGLVLIVKDRCQHLQNDLRR